MSSIANYFVYKSPIGDIYIATIPKINGNDNAIFCIGIRESQEVFLEKIQKQLGNNTSLQPKEITTVLHAMENYFQGGKYAFDDISTVFTCGTAFQKNVWNTLKEVPYGETRSYKWISQKINNPKGYRAVGTANGMNPIPIIFPCHRVIRETGGLGGYRYGLNIKRYLLELESTHILPKKI